MNLSFRYATVADAPLVADISRETFYDTFAADNSKEDMDKFMNEQFTKGRLMLEVGAPENIFLLAMDGHDVVGYIKLRNGAVPPVLLACNALEIARLYVRQPFLHRGVGSVLMQRCITEAEQRGNDALWLGVWERNQRAIAFYHRWGFEKIGEWDFLLGDDLQRDWLMKKTLH